MYVKGRRLNLLNYDVFLSLRVALWSTAGKRLLARLYVKFFCAFVDSPCSIMLHYIWVFTVSQSNHLLVSSIQRVILLNILYCIHTEAHGLTSMELGDNCIQNFHLGRYIVGYMDGNLVLRRRVSGDVKRDFRTYIRRYTSPNENFEYGYPHSNALLTFPLQKDSGNVLCCAYTNSGCKLHKTVASCIYSLVNQ